MQLEASLMIINGSKILLQIVLHNIAAVILLFKKVSGYLLMQRYISARESAFAN